MRGRKPKPVERQIAEGDPRKHGVHKLEERLDASVKATSGLPACPRYLKGRARYAWRLWSEELAVMQLSKRPDGQMLEGACRQFERAVQADLILDKEGLFVDKKVMTESGEIVVLDKKKHPAVEISNRSWLLVKAFCSEFGLSPVSRTRLTIDKPDTKEEDLSKLLSQPRAATGEGTAIH